MEIEEQVYVHLHGIEGIHSFNEGLYSSHDSLASASTLLCKSLQLQSTVLSAVMGNILAGCSKAR